MSLQKTRKKIFALIAVTVLITCGAAFASFCVAWHLAPKAAPDAPRAFALFSLTALLTAAAVVLSVFIPVMRAAEREFNSLRDAARTEVDAAVSGDMKRVSNQLQRREIVWSCLQEIAQSMTSTPNFQAALERVVDSVKNFTQAYGIGLMILEGDKLVPLVFAGYRDVRVDLDNFSLSFGDASISTRALNTHAVQWAEDVASDPEYREIDPRVRSEVTVPLYQGAQFLGVMIISFDRRYRRSEEFMMMISPVTASLAGYMSSWKARREIRSSYEYLMLKFQEIADIYHHETASHLIRVGRYSAMAAAWMGSSRQDQQDIMIFSRAHDLGKIRVPVNIVIKTSGLTLEEFELMKKHTVWGAELIGEAEWLTVARNICASHHEKWNGNGYPAGLRGAGIPLEARIVSLVDVYDALRSPRSYKDSYTHEDAVTIILEGDGRTMPEHFDPNMLEFFRHNHEEMARIFEETESDSIE